MKISSLVDVIFSPHACFYKSNEDMPSQRKNIVTRGRPLLGELLLRTWWG